MTSYHSTKSDFPDTLYTYDVNVSKTITDKLDDIEAVTKVIKENGVSHLYVQTGDASLGKEMPESDFTSAESKTGKLLGYATRLHDEIMANIDSKFVRGMRTVFGNLSDNLNTDEFKTKNMTYMADGGTYGVITAEGYEYVPYQTPKSYTLTQILDHKASPISATKKVYDRQLKLAKEKAEMADQKANELQKKLESGSLTSESQIRDYQTQIKSYRSLGDLKNKEEELMTSLYGTGMGNQSAVQIKSSAWQEANKEWLEPIERYLGIGLVAVSLVATVATFGAASPVTSVTGAIGTGYALADSAHTAVTGNSMISGTRQTVAEQNWAAAEFWTTAATLGASRYLKDTSRVYKAINYADDAVNVGHVAYNGIVEGEDPTLSLLSFAGGKVVGQLQASRSVAGESGVKVDSRVDISGKSVRLEGESNRVSGLDAVDANKISVGTSAATITAGKGAVDVPKAKVETVEGPTRAGEVERVSSPEDQRSRILRNIEESRKARETSNFDQYLREEYHAQGKYFPERVDLPNGKHGYLSADTFDGQPVPVRSREFVDAEGHIKWPDADGFVTDSAGNPITEPANLKAGQVIDRYGGNGGRFTSPLVDGQKLSYTTRGLPYPEGYQPYHQYEVVKDITEENIIEGFENAPVDTQTDIMNTLSDYNMELKDLANIRQGEIAKVFGQGGGTQIQFGSSISIYEDLGLLREVTK